MKKSLPIGKLFLRVDVGIGPLKQCGYPINNTIDHRCRYAIDDHRAGDGEHLRADAQDETLCLCQLRTHYFVF